jgi:UDP-N-acetylmuramoyl-L-alanyl-D-glutamate--2,6-diaminopimelate ligase
VRWIAEPRSTEYGHAVPGIDPARPLPRPQRVPPCPLTDLIAVLGPDLLGPAGAAVTGAAFDGAMVTGMTHTSGEVRPGDLYAALPGARHHGAAFAAEAVAAGARAVLTDPAGADMIARSGAGATVPVLAVPDPRGRMGDAAARVYGDPTARLPVIGITGTSGKTTTAYLIEAGLRASGRTPALLGTVETRLGDLVIESVRTTPEATDLHALLAVAEEHGVDAVVMEVSSHALALGRVGGVRFVVGGFTNFGVDHLDFHRDLDDYFAAKARLFDGRCAVEIINHDDPALARLRRPGTVTYSAAGDRAATWRAEDVEPGDRSGFTQHFTAVGAARPVTTVRVPAGVGQPGRHSIANALLAIASLVAVGVEPALAAAGVAVAPGVPGRLERIPVSDGEGGALGVVDYAHKPDAVIAVLASLRRVAEARSGKLICVVGAGGDRDRGKRAPMGAAAARGADLVVVTDDNPRTEDPAAIRAEVLAGARTIGGVDAVEVADRRAAIEEAVRRAAAADVVAVLGKGHERGQEVADKVYPFDDRTALADALAAVTAPDTTAPSETRP